ncbi:hypothetical protein Q7O_001677 [Pectobacterium carotovorum subsp. carotovorum PCCS1]|nr:hypothetical protein [Pectobacterium carotovorum subsp. carotovorum PCCS1]
MWQYVAFISDVLDILTTENNTSVVGDIWWRYRTSYSLIGQ